VASRSRRLLITDLDNTLYDWVTFFARAFDAMVDAMVDLLAVDRGTLLDEFRAVHQRLGDSEHPYAALELPSVRARYPDANQSELALALDEPLHRFNSVRKETLALYPGVEMTLTRLRQAGITIVGHTEAIAPNAYYRLTRLNIAQRFKHLYVLQGQPVNHPRPDRLPLLEPPRGLIRSIPRSERKPNPKLLLDICEREGVPASAAVYVGDSLVRDMSMALDAGVTAVWAKYGTVYDPALWSTLVRVTHWTAEDVEREKALSGRRVEPDLAISSFSELLPLFIDTRAADEVGPPRSQLN